MADEEKMKAESQENAGERADVPKSENPDQVSKPYDTGYKDVLKNRRILLHMLRKYTDFAWAADIRESEIEFVDKEFSTDRFDTYESDLICRIRHGRQEVFLFLLMELQSRVDYTMPFRLLVYMVGMWEEYFRNVPEKERKHADFRLPIVVPVVLYNGARNWTALRQFRDYLQDGGDVRGVRGELPLCPDRCEAADGGCDPEQQHGD